jgi:hypothetical protein
MATHVTKKGARAQELGAAAQCHIIKVGFYNRIGFFLINYAYF